MFGGDFPEEMGAARSLFCHLEIRNPILYWSPKIFDQKGEREGIAALGESKSVEAFFLLRRASVIVV